MAVLTLPPPGIRNFRDVGGHRTEVGARVRTGVLYRSTDLRDLDDAGAEALAALGIRAVYDLRSDLERGLWPERDRLPDGVAYVTADVLADVPDENPATMRDLFADPEAASRAFGDGRAVAFFEAKYRQFVSLPSARAAYAVVFTRLADATGRPGIIHCATGKDRTGWAVAALQFFLGVPSDVVLDDYLASNGQMPPGLRAAVRDFVDRGGDAAVIEPLMGVRPAFLEAAVREMEARFGSIERYIAAGLGLAPAVTDALRDAFLEP